jgi:hypothetical protein
MDESNGNGEGRIHDFSDSRDDNNKTIKFLTTGQQAATFSWQDKRTLSQIEQMTGYTVKDSGVVSQFKHGGFVVYEQDGHGLVAAIFSLKVEDYDAAIIACDELVLNGYSDWRLPARDELEAIMTMWEKNRISNFYRPGYYLCKSSTDRVIRYGLTWNFPEGNFTHAVRTF